VLAQLINYNQLSGVMQDKNTRIQIVQDRLGPDFYSFYWMFVHYFPVVPFMIEEALPANIPPALSHLRQ